MPLYEIGHVTAPSGVLLIVDTGYLGMWSHDRPPVMPDGILSSDEATARANASVDLRLVGADAAAAGELLEWSAHPLFVYDQPPTRGKVWDRLDEIVREHGFDARLEPLPERVPHRTRVDLALEYGGGAGEIQFHGVPAVAIGGVPRDRALMVWGERDEDACRWRRVLVSVREGSIMRSESIGHVAVDYARLLVADADCLAAWEHEEPIDGLADFLFWGLNAAQVAADFEAPALEDGQFGWLDLPIETAIEYGVPIEEYRDRSGVKFVTDFRPHSHHWLVMRDTRTSETESGMADIGGATVCNFMTTWGDGFFEVYRDLNEDDDLIRIRIELDRTEMLERITAAQQSQES